MQSGKGMVSSCFIVLELTYDEGQCGRRGNEHLYSLSLGGLR